MGPFRCKVHIRSTRPKRAALAALALSLMLAVLISRYFSGSGNTAIRNPARTWVRPATAIVGGLFFAVVVTRRKVPLQFLRLDEGEILVSLLALTGIVGLGLLVAQDKKMSWRLTARDLIVAALAFLCLNGLALLTIDREFYSLRLVLGDWNRLMALGLTAVLAVPFFMLQDDLLRRLQGASGSAFREFMISCGGPLFVIAMLCLGIYFIGPKLFRFSPAIAGLLAYCAFASALMRVSNKSTSAGVVFSSLVTAWIISVGFYDTEGYPCHR
jgi:UDP-N-acetylmuramyl pentapeptide phosphotransferase/UDP-N-acetylglucosamine-1-phosphate transferase